jgi:putative flavoprotein involved in K+ transport
MRLLTPNWQSGLPGLPYDGADPNGYMTAGEVVDLVMRYVVEARAPILRDTNVTSLRRTEHGYELTTSQGEIGSRAVLLAAGACNQPTVPALAQAIPSQIEQLTPFDYRNPDQLPDGGVLVVGAAATGVQLASELRQSGRPVILAVGEHVRLPRTYRGRDILWWMDASGLWGQRYDEVDDLTRARRLPSPQLVGTPERTTLDLNALTAQGVELVGRWSALRENKALFSGGLRNVCSLADLKLERLLELFDDWARSTGMEPEGSPERFAPTEVPRSTRLELDLASGEIRSIVWATGFRPDYRWLDVPVVDPKGHLRHDGGVVVESPGLYALGLPVLRRRKSTFIHGIEDDARDVIDHLHGHL